MSGRLIAVVLMGLVVVLLLVAGPAACNKIRSMGAQSRMDNAQGEAFRNSAGAAIETQGNVNQREVQSEELGRANAKDIRNAEGADAPVSPAARDAGFASLCKRAAFRADERNRVRCARAEQLEAARFGADVRR